MSKDEENQDEKNQKQKYLWHMPRPNEDKERIIGWDIWSAIIVYWTDTNKVYAKWKDLSELLNHLKQSDSDFIEIPLKEGILSKKILCHRTESEDFLIIILADVKGQTEILSIGKSHLGLLGQGQDKS